MSATETADPAQLPDAADDAIVAEVSTMLGGDETPGELLAASDGTPVVAAVAPQAEQTSAMAPGPMDDAESISTTEAAVETALGQVEADLSQLEKTLKETLPDIPVDLDTPLASAEAAQGEAEEPPPENLSDTTHLATEQNSVVEAADTQPIEAAPAPSERPANVAPAKQAPLRRWYHPLRIVNGIAAVLMEVLVLMDAPFAGLSPTIKTIAGCAGIATGAVAAATWGSIIYRTLAS